MTKKDIFLFLKALRPDMEEGSFENIYDPLIYHIEEKILKEVLHLDRKFDQKNLVLATPYDDVYWTYVLSLLYLNEGRVEMYQEYRKLFEQAWENLCHQVFLQKEAFKLAPWYPGDEELL